MSPHSCPVPSPREGLPHQEGLPPPPQEGRGGDTPPPAPPRFQYQQLKQELERRFPGALQVVSFGGAGTTAWRGGCQPGPR